jgi:hypothetical protein
MSNEIKIEILALSGCIGLLGRLENRFRGSGNGSAFYLKEARLHLMEAYRILKEEVKPAKPESHE